MKQQEGLHFPGGRDCGNQLQYEVCVDLVNYRLVQSDNGGIRTADVVMFLVFAASLSARPCKEKMIATVDLAAHAPHAPVTSDVSQASSRVYIDNM
ncbi:hypothetical protein SUGI_0335620 [Cryptomeria japonica]|nr:hypothetical protein SUGI_0335620 [Cryptomeria japonica]